MDDSAVTVSVRRRDGGTAEDLPWITASADLLESAAPWRTFRWYKGQKHAQVRDARDERLRHDFPFDFDGLLTA
jgi:hypothetical protein